MSDSASKSFMTHRAPFPFILERQVLKMTYIPTERNHKAQMERLSMLIATGIGIDALLSPRHDRGRLQRRQAKR